MKCKKSFQKCWLICNKKEMLRIIIFTTNMFKMNTKKMRVNCQKLKI
jgi:hypothetical protein